MFRVDDAFKVQHFRVEFTEDIYENKVFKMKIIIYQSWLSSLSNFYFFVFQ